MALQESLKSGAEGLNVIGSFVRLGYVRYLQGRYDDAIHEYERERAYLGLHDHALKERALIEIEQKTGAALWRKGDSAAATRAFDAAIAAFRVRQARGAADPFTTYYLAAAYALRGQVGRGHAAARRGRAEAAGPDPRPGAARSRLRLDSQ